MKVAALQYCGSADIQRNLAILTELIEAAATAKARWVCLPECANMMGAGREALLATAEAEDNSASLAHLQALAKTHQITIFAGSLLLRPAGADRLVNRSYIITPDGAIAAHYDKIHMFDADVGDGVSYQESASFIPGDRAVMADIDNVPVGLSICYDVRFAPLYRQLAQAGAQIMMTPAAFTRNSGRAHWHVLQRARAIETGSFVIAAAQAGTHDDGRQTFGHALIIAPDGRILADGGADESPHFILADLDLSEVHKARDSITAWRHNPPYQLN